MTATQQFIEDAIAGGWNPKPMYYSPFRVNAGGVDWHGDDQDAEFYSVYHILLISAAWQAVGKVRGWNEHDAINQEMYHQSGGAGLIPIGMYGYVDKWQRFILHRAKGKSIEEALSAITSV